MDYLELGPLTPHQRYTGSPAIPDGSLAERLQELGKVLVSERPVLPSWALPRPEELDRKHGPFLVRKDKDLIATRRQVWREVPAIVLADNEQIPAPISGAFLGVPGTDQYCVGIAESISGQLMASTLTPSAFPPPERTRENATRYRFREGVRVTLYGVHDRYLEAYVEGIPSRSAPDKHWVRFTLERLRPGAEPRGVFRIKRTSYEGWTTERRTSYNAQRNQVLAPRKLEDAPQLIMNQQYLSAGEIAATLLVDDLLRRNQPLWVDGKLQRPGRFEINHPVFRWNPEWAGLAYRLSERLSVLDKDAEPIPTRKDHVEVALSYVAATGALQVPEREYHGPLSLRLLKRL